jgi:hypothetical protein
MQARFERKFIINDIQKSALWQAIHLLFETDKHQINRNSYPVFSRYYDTHNLDFFDQKMDGEFEHIKLRLRQYSNEFKLGQKCFLESKYKENEQQFKFRINLDPSSNYLNPLSWLENTSPQNLNLFKIINIASVVPTCNVFYERTALETWLHGQFIRLNFDSNICYLYPNEFEANDYVHKARQTLGHDATILEVKTTSREIPPVIMQIFRHYNVVERRFSKYTESMMKLSTTDTYQGVRRTWN